MKKNIFLVSEQEKNSILNMHINATKNLYLSKYGILKESGLINEEMKYIKNTTTNVATMFSGDIIPAGSVEITKLEFEILTNQKGTETLPAEAEPMKQTKYKQGACKKGGNKKDCAESIQIRLNDECKSDILNNSLINFPKARTGTEGSFKLKEDGNLGSGTRSAYISCKLPNVVSTPVVAQQGGGGSNQTQITIPVGGNITANDIQTIIS